MAPIRKGDGTGFTPKGFAGVRKGDGTILYSAEPAIPDSVVDNFEDADSDPVGPYEAGETIADYYTQDTTQFTRQQTTVISDSYSLKASATGASTYRIFSTNGLPQYPSTGDTLRATLRMQHDGASDDSGIAFGVQDGSNHYRVILRTVDDDAFLQSIENGGINSLDTTTISLSNNVDYDIVVTEWASAGNITVKVQDNGTVIGTLSATDQTFSSGGIGWLINHGGSGSGQTSYYDNYEINF